MGWPVLGKFTDQDSNNQMGDGHEDTAPKEQRSSSHFIHRPDAGADTYKLGDIEHSGHDKLHAMVQAHCSEERRGVINERIDPHELLKEHKSYTNVRPPPTSAPEAVRP